MASELAANGEGGARLFALPIPLNTVINGKYRLETVIAEGGMGVVYAAWHGALERRVAIKVMRGELSENSEAVRRFLNEARALAKLRGPHRSQVLDIGRVPNGPPYMVLEYLEGFDLRTLLDRCTKLPIERAASLLMQACDAVGEAHASGIVHRDLKPENFFLTETRAGTLLKLIDFGISKRLDIPQAQRHLTVDGESLGSPHYMSPEQMSSPKTIDARSDIWSLGVVLFELISGKMPFDGATVAVVFAEVLGGMPKPLTEYLPDAPAGIIAIVDRCLRVNRDERFPSTDALREALAPFAVPTVAAANDVSVTVTHEPYDGDVEYCEHERLTPVPRVHLTTFSEIQGSERSTRRRAIRVGLVAAAAAALLGYFSNGFVDGAAPTLRTAQSAAGDVWALTAHSVRELASRTDVNWRAPARRSAAVAEPATSETPIVAATCEDAVDVAKTPSSELGEASVGNKCRRPQQSPAAVVFTEPAAQP